MDRARKIRRLEALANLLDSRFAIPGTGLRFGLDSLIGLIPGLGDGATALSGAYIVVRAHRLGVGWPVLARMILNVLIDLVLGTLPVFGDLFDFAFKANLRNVALLKEALGMETGDGVAPPRGPV